MDEGWAAKQTGTRDMKLATTELSAETSVWGILRRYAPQDDSGTSWALSPTMHHGTFPSLVGAVTQSKTGRS